MTTRYAGDPVLPGVRPQNTNMSNFTTERHQSNMSNFTTERQHSNMSNFTTERQPSNMNNFPVERQPSNMNSFTIERQLSNTNNLTTSRPHPPERRRTVVTRPPRQSFCNGSDISTSSMQPNVGASPAVSLRAARVVKTPRRPAVNSSAAAHSPRQSHKVFFRPRSKGVWAGTHHGTDSQDFTADSDDSEYSSSCLSTSTQATTVYDSDITVGKGSHEGRPSQGKVVRAPTPTAPVRRGGLRQTSSRAGTNAGTEASSSSRSGSGVTVETPKRTVHIEVLAAKESQPDARHQKQIEHVLMEKIEQLELEKKGWHEKESSALKELEDAMERSSSLGIEKEEAEKERDDERKQRDEDRQHIEELEQEFIEQGKMLGDLRLEFDKQTWDVEAYEKEKNTWVELRAVLEEKCAELEKSLQEMKDHKDAKQTFLVEQVASLQIIKESLEGRVGALDSEHVAQQAEIGNLLTERDQLREESEQQQASLKSMAEEKVVVEEEKRKVQARVEELEGENTTLKEQVQGLEADVQGLKTQIEGLEGEKSEQGTQITALTTECDELKAENESLTTKIAAQEGDITKLREELAPLNEELERLRQDSPVAEREGLIAATALLKAQNSDQEAEMVKMRDEISGAKEEVTKLEEVQKTLQAENDELKAKTAEPQQDTSATEELQKQISGLEEEKKRFEEEAGKVTSLSAEKAELESKKAELEAKAAQLESAKAELEQHASQVPLLRTENANLVSQLSAARQQAEELGAAQQKSSAEMADLQSFVNRLATPKRAQSESRSTTSSKKKSSARNSKEELVVVRNPGDRGSM